MSNYIKTHITDIMVGDVILFDGKETTVCADNIKHDSFMGTSLFGDSYHLGNKPVMKKVYNKVLTCSNLL